MASKTKSTFLTMTITLLVVGVIASTALAMVYKVTKEPIAKAEKEKKEKAIKQVVPKFDNSPFVDVYKIPAEAGNDSLVCFPAKKGEEVVGVAIETYTDDGFTGRFTVMVGFLPDGTIYNSAILRHMETPGLGDKMAKKKSLSIKKHKDGSRDTLWWSQQFIQKNPKDFDLRVKKDGGDIVSITAATISSRAYCDAVQRAYDAFMKNSNN